MSRYRTLCVLIFGAWIISIGVVFSGGRTDDANDPSPTSSVQVDEGEHWTGIYQGGRKIGFSRTKIESHGDRTVFHEESTLRMKVMDVPQSVLVRARATFVGGSKLESFSFSLGGSAVALSLRGEAIDSQFRVESTIGSETSSTTIPSDEALSYPGFLRERLRQSSLRPGLRISSSVLDPMSMSRKELSFEVERREPLPGNQGGIPVWRVRSRLGEIESAVWVDDRGEFLREEGPMGFVMVRESPQEAPRLGNSELEEPDITVAAAIPAPRLRDPRTRDSLRLRVSGGGAPRAGSSGAAPGRDGLVLLHRVHLEPGNTYELPYTRGDMFEELSSNFLLQAEHPRIRAAVSEILRDERDAQRAVGLILNGVYARLRKTPTVSLPNAVQVLDRGEGDCNEHAVLFAALARAAGIPTRIVAGLVYEDRAFLYHAWNEVWLNRWVPVDATFGQFPTDATHLPLVAGDVQAMFEVAQAVGRLEISVVDQDAIESD